jgi:hypothetical protein
MPNLLRSAAIRMVENALPFESGDIYEIDFSYSYSMFYCIGLRMADGFIKAM